MKLEKFTRSFRVSQAEIDALNHVNNVKYLEWVQNIAQEHWEKLSSTDLNSRYVWVVVRHELDYLRPAILNDFITISTWVGKTSGVKSERFVEIKKNDILVAKAKTIWCLLDKQSMRPIRIPKEIIRSLYPKIN